MVVSDRASERQNIDYFAGFIDGCDVDAKLTISCTCRRIRERGGDELLFRFDGFYAVL